MGKSSGECFLLFLSQSSYRSLLFFRFPLVALFRLRYLMEIESHNKTRKEKLHFVDRPFTILSITIFGFQVAAAWRRCRLLRRSRLVKVASLVVDLLVYQFTLLTILAALNKTLYRLVVFVYVQHTFATAVARDSDTLLTSSLIQMRFVSYSSRWQVVKQTCDHDEKEEKYEDEVEHQQGRSCH